MEYWQTLKDTVENLVEKEEAKEEQQQDDEEQYDTVPNINLVYDGITRKRIQGDRKFKLCQHKDDYGSAYTTH